MYIALFIGMAMWLGFVFALYKANKEFEESVNYEYKLLDDLFDFIVGMEI